MRDAYVYSDPPEAEPIAHEGGVLYERIGGDVYFSQHGGQRRYYALYRNWPSTQAARRIRGELGKRHPAAASYGYEEVLG